MFMRINTSVELQDQVEKTWICFFSPISWLVYFFPKHQALSVSSILKALKKTQKLWFLHGWSTYPPLTYPPPIFFFKKRSGKLIVDISHSTDSQTHWSCKNPSKVSSTSSYKSFSSDDMMCQVDKKQTEYWLLLMQHQWWRQEKTEWLERIGWFCYVDQIKSLELVQRSFQNTDG